MELKIGDYVRIKPYLRDAGMYRQSLWATVGKVLAIYNTDCNHIYYVALVDFIRSYTPYQIRCSDLELVEYYDPIMDLLAHVGEPE